jgi:hypothetical protein
MRRVARRLLTAAAVIALAGCGGEDEPSAQSPAPSPSPSPSPSPPPPTGSAPTISGTPPTATLQSRAYAFRPTAADADGDRLTFGIGNRPPWAAFNSTTGRLTGTPSPADIGAYNNVTITVSDGTRSASLAPFNITVVAVATGSAMLSWTPPTSNTDGSPLTDLMGYRIYWGTQQGEYANSTLLGMPGLATYVVDQLTPATWHFVVTAVNGNGVESSLSNRATKTIP